MAGAGRTVRSGQTGTSGERRRDVDFRHPPHAGRPGATPLLRRLSGDAGRWDADLARRLPAVRLVAAAAMLALVRGTS